MIRSEFKFNKLTKLFFCTVPVAGLVLLSGCVGTEQDLRYLNDQIVALNSRVSGVEDTVQQRLGGTLETRLGGVKEQQAEIGQDVEELKQEVGRISSRLEEHRVLVQRAVERDTTGLESDRARISDLETRTARLEASVSKVMDHLNLAQPPQASTSPVAPLPAPVPTTEPRRPLPAEEPAVKPVKPDEELYNRNVAAFREGKFDSAMAGFERLLAQYPDSNFAENSQFWIGECHMSLKQFEQAILAYQKVITTYPEGKKVPGATYRQAVAFHEINDKISARLLLNRVIRSYPQSEEAKLAKKKLDAIK
jgi:tol-pal system protein YbgF